MVFSSYLFLFWFLPLALAAYYLTPARGRHWTLTIFSYVFYGWANPWFMVLMFFTTTWDYTMGRLIAGQAGNPDPAALIPGGTRCARQKWALAGSIAVDLGLLAFFKYFNFALDNYNAATAVLGVQSWQYEGFFRVILPLGISFYTFQSLSYTIDVYRGDARAITRFIDYACYVAMFPQLVAGPIVRFQEVADQLRSRVLSSEKFARGVMFFAFGMAKKVLLANPCGKIADTVFAAGTPAAGDAWYGIVAYAFQIYFDFSGYSDMAIGLGLMLGFVFAKNFDSPYQARSITEFWQRWHLSLSTWLRDYLYIPLGGNRHGSARTYRNLMLVMLLGGLWHGASWNFVLWGAIHGGALAVERMRGKESIYQRFPAVVQMAVTFCIVLIAWVFFRAETLPAALRYLGSLAGLGGTAAAATVRGLIYTPYYLVNIVLAAVVVWTFPQTWDFTRKLGPVKIIWGFFLLALAVAALGTQSYNPFIYFIF